MAALLLGDLFDRFLLVEGEVTTFNTFSINGFVHTDFFERDSEAREDSPPSYSPWKDLRELCFSIIRGKRTPLSFKFIFALPKELVVRLLQEAHLDFQPEIIQGLYLNFRFDGTSLTCTTGTSLSIFTLDKSLEHSFDQWTRAFFSRHQIDWE